MSLRPVPSHIVALIQSGRYVELWDLLGDNAAIGRYMEDIHCTCICKDQCPSGVHSAQGEGGVIYSVLDMLHPDSVSSGYDGRSDQGEIGIRYPPG